MVQSRRFELLITSAILLLVAGFATEPLRAGVAGEAQKTVRTVWDGVYSRAQAARGKGEYELHCASCHDTGEAPSLFGDAFMRRWFEDNLNTLFGKIRETMPADAPGSLDDNTDVDIMAFMLEASGFPSGANELSSRAEWLTGIVVADKSGPGGPVPNFSLVQVVGCLTQSADGLWMLTKGTEPERTRDAGGAPAPDLKTLDSKPLGNRVFRLLDFSAVGRDAQKGSKVQATGLLIRQPNDDRLNLTSLQVVGQSCLQ